MDEYLICSLCGAENSPGNELCANCGSRLPARSELLCTNCGSRNDAEREYCNVCGASLADAEPLGSPMEAADSEPEAFSLPARKPGDTGDLDPNALPDWLRTGNLRPLEELPSDEPAKGSAKLPDIEGLTPEKKATADLPDWLVRDSDPEPIIDAPASITTDHYFDLLSQPPSDAAGDEDQQFDGNESLLPDWLLGSEPASAEEAPDESKEEISRWLAELGQPEGESKEVAETPEEVLPSEEDEFAWMAKLGPVQTDGLSVADDAGAEPEEEHPLEQGELPDWLAELGPPQTDVLSDPIRRDLLEPDESDSRERALPDWISELGPPKTDVLSQPMDVEDAPEEELVEEDFLLPDWLADLGPLDTHVLAEPTSVEEDEAEPEALEAEASDWDALFEPAPAISEPDEDLEELLPDVSGDWAEEEAEPHLAEEFEEEAIEPLPLGDWLAAPGEDAIAEAPVEPTTVTDGWAAQDAGEEIGLPDWLAADESALRSLPEDEPEPEVEELEGPAEDEEALPAWLTEPPFAPAAAEVPEEESGREEEDELAVRADELTAWFDELEPSDAGDLEMAEEAITEPDEEIVGVEMDLAGWMDELGAVSATLLEEEEQESLEEDFAAEEVPTSVAGEIEVGEPLSLAESSEELLPEGESEQQQEDISTWFDDLEAEAPSEAVPEEALLEGLFAAEVPDAGLDWLSAIEEVQEPSGEAADKPAISWDAPEIVEEADRWEGQPEGQGPDWLAQLAEFSDDLAEVDEVDVEAGPPEATAELPELAAEDVEPVVSFSTGQLDLTGERDRSMPAPDDEWGVEWLEDESALEEIAEEDELPDWLDELRGSVPEQPIESHISDEISTTEDLPEWVASLRPMRESDMGSILPSALSLPGDDAEALADLSGEFGAADLPDWLLGEGAALRAETAGADGWFGRDAAGDWFALDSDEGMGSDWGDILGALPPAVPVREQLVPADIPEWIQQLKPGSLKPAAAQPEQEASVAEAGPLAGLPGVIGIEPIIAVSRVGGGASAFTVTREQQQQVALMRRLTQWEPEPTKAVGVRRVTAASPWLHLLLALIILAAVFVGLWLPDLLGPGRELPPAHLRDVHSILDGAAGHTVLVAFEFTPAMSGELVPVAEILLAQADSNSTNVVVTSQFAAGMGIAAGLLEETTSSTLGLIPGEAVGLRQLGDCLANSPDCSELWGRSLEADLRQSLEDVAVIVVLTHDRDSLINWIEQVGTTNQLPIIIGVTQSLSPLVRPYLASGQVKGMFGGMDDTLAYSREHPEAALSRDIDARESARQVSRLLASGLLLLGAIVYGVTGTPRKGSPAASSDV